MVRYGAPKLIWDNALYFKVCVRSHTSRDVYILHAEVPETVMLGETSDIGRFCGHEFYDWFMFRDEPIQYPDKNPVLGRYLVLAIDIGPEMMAKIMKANIEVVHHSTYRGPK